MKGTPFRWPQSDLSDQGVGQAGATAGDGAQDPQAGLQLGTLRPTRQSGTATAPLCSGPEVEEVTGRGSDHNRPSHYTVRMPNPNAAHGPEGHRRRSAHAIPDQSRGDEVAQGRQLVLPEVVPGTGEPSDRRRQAPTSACKASGGPATGTSHNPAALHDPPLSCHQTTGGQHDGGDHLPARHIESDKGPQHGLGVLGGPDGSVCAADHRTSAPTGHTQAVAGCHACPTSTGRILLIRLLNSSNTCYINASVRAWLFRLPISSSLAHRSRRGGISTMHVGHCMFMHCAHGDPCSAIGPTCISNRMPAKSWNIS